MSTARIPPIQCLLTFEALARLRSVTQASEELCVTPSAVSHRVRQLEQIIGTKLFGRADFSLTTEGSEYLAHVREGLAILQKVPSSSAAPGKRKLRLALTPTFAGVSHKLLDEVGGIQWPCNAASPCGTPIMHVDQFVRGKGRFVETEYVPTSERTSRKFPLILTTGRILSQYNVGAQTRRTDNVRWWDEDVLEIHPSDALTRGIQDGQWVSLRSRKGEVSLRSRISTRMTPGVVYTTFHYPETGVNVVTTENSDWATSCPEYKVTAVEVAPANHRSPWQQAYALEMAGMRPVAARPVDEAE